MVQGEKSGRAGRSALGRRQLLQASGSLTAAGAVALWLPERAAAAGTADATKAVSSVASAAQDAVQPQSTLIQAPALPGAPPISSRDRVYTTDQTSNTVTVIDPSTNTTLGTITLGVERLGMLLNPQYIGQADVHGMGFSRDGRYLGVVSVTTNTVTIIATADNRIVSKTAVGRSPHEGFFTADGKAFWVAIRAVAEVNIVDPVAGGVVGRVPTADGPSKVVFSPDGRLAYVNHIRSASVDVVDVAARKVVYSIPLHPEDSFSSDAMLSPDGQELWVAHKMTGRVSVVDAKAFTLLTVLQTGKDTNHPNFVTTPQAAYAYVTVGGLNQTLVYRRNGANPQLMQRIQHSAVEPHGIWPSADNTRVYVVQEKSDMVDVIDTATMQVIQSIPNGQESQAIVYVVNAVPEGDGTAHLTRQGLGLPVANMAASFAPTQGMAAVAQMPTSAGGSGPAPNIQVTVRQVDGLDMVQIEAFGLAPGQRYMAAGQRGSDRIPILTFTANDKGGVPQALAFTQYFGVYSGVIVTPA